MIRTILIKQRCENLNPYRLEMTDQYIVDLSEEMPLNLVVGIYTLRAADNLTLYIPRIGMEYERSARLVFNGENVHRFPWRNCGQWHTEKFNWYRGEKPNLTELQCEISWLTVNRMLP